MDTGPDREGWRRADSWRSRPERGTPVVHPPTCLPAGRPTARSQIQQSMKFFSLLFALAPTLAGAQAARNDTVSVPIRDVHYDVTFMRANGQQRAVDVAMTFTATGNAPVVL